MLPEGILPLRMLPLLLPIILLRFGVVISLNALSIGVFDHHLERPDWTQQEVYSKLRLTFGLKESQMKQPKMDAVLQRAIEKGWVEKNRRPRFEQRRRVPIGENPHSWTGAVGEFIDDTANEYRLVETGGRREGDMGFCFGTFIGISYRCSHCESAGE